MNKLKTMAFFIVVGLLIISLSGCAAKKDFTYSTGITNDGFWKGVKALDNVDLCQYEGITIPKDVHEVPEESIRQKIESILADYTTENQITNGIIQDGDTVNIDFVGSIDGVEFDNGSTEGQGTNVTIGVTNYIEGFLEQLIGHAPGESFDINVTFPQDYNNESLRGKNAVFAITVNYIVEMITPDLTDAFVAENLSSSHGWDTVAQMEAGIVADMKNQAITYYLQEHIMENSKVTDLPQSMVKYQEDSVILSYKEYAKSVGMEFANFLSYMGLSHIDELKEMHLDENIKTAEFHLILQAIAEDMGISVNDDDVESYFANYEEIDDISTYKDYFGIPYLKMIVLHQSILDYLIDNAVME